MIRYLSTEQVLSLHHGLLDSLSGDPGIRDLTALDAAVARPSLVFDGDDLYPTMPAKGAALLHALVTTAPFTTGSPATALVAAECFLNANGVTLSAADKELQDLVASVATGHAPVEAVAIWITQRVAERTR
jgi:death-on-curing protein